MIQTPATVELSPYLKNHPFRRMFPVSHVHPPITEGGRSASGIPDQHRPVYSVPVHVIVHVPDQLTSLDAPAHIWPAPAPPLIREDERDNESTIHLTDHRVVTEPKNTASFFDRVPLLRLNGIQNKQGCTS